MVFCVFLHVNPYKCMDICIVCLLSEGKSLSLLKTNRYEKKNIDRIVCLCAFKRVMGAITLVR